MEALDGVKDPRQLAHHCHGGLPHTDVGRALEMALSMDVPFWPQLPNYSYYEDMYVQAAEHFPGILLDMDQRTLRFSMDKFAEELEETLLRFEDAEYFDVSETYSAAYHRFLEMDLADRSAIRGQLEGPISFGFNILDQNDRPILFDDTVRPFMLEFMAKRLNVQLARLKRRNDNAFMFVDEPGLQFLFSAMAGYGDLKAKSDLDEFFSQVDRPRGIHLCGNPDKEKTVQRAFAGKISVSPVLVRVRVHRTVEVLLIDYTNSHSIQHDFRIF